MKAKKADGSGEAKTLRTGWSPSYSADGRYLLFADFGKDSDWDIWYLDTRFGAEAGFAADEQGRRGCPAPVAGWEVLRVRFRRRAATDDVYLKRFPAGEGRWQVSTEGGSWPRFNRRGDKLYYAVGDAIMEVDLALGAEPQLGAPRELFKRRPLGWGLIFGWPPGFDVSPDGSRFVIAEPQANAHDLSGIIVEENWSQER